MLDTGAVRSYLRREFSDGRSPLELGPLRYGGVRPLRLADGTVAIGESVTFEELHVGPRLLRTPEFVLVEGLAEDAILGVQLMQRLGILVDPPAERARFKEDWPREGRASA